MTEPFDAAVVKAAQVDDPTIPKRDSLPSIFPPAWSWLLISTIPFCSNCGVAICSLTAILPSAATSIIPIATKIAIP